MAIFKHQTSMYTWLSKRLDMKNLGTQVRYDQGIGTSSVLCLNLSLVFRQLFQSLWGRISIEFRKINRVADKIFIFG